MQTSDNMLKNVKQYETYSEYMASREEVFVIGYDNIFQIPDIFIFTSIIMKNKEYYNQFMNLDLLQEYDEYAIQPKLLERTERNIVKWLRREGVTDEQAVELYYQLNQAKDEMYKEAPLTDFALGFDLLASHPYTQKIVILLPSMDQRIINRITSITDMGHKVFLRALDSNENMYDVIVNEYSNFTTMIMDDTDLIHKVMTTTDVENKSFVLPYTGYNFELIDGELLVSKNQLEQVAYDSKCNIGFMTVKKFEEIHYGVG